MVLGVTAYPKARAIQGRRTQKHEFFPDAAPESTSFDRGRSRQLRSTLLQLGCVTITDAHSSSIIRSGIITKEMPCRNEKPGAGPGFSEPRRGRVTTIP